MVVNLPGMSGIQFGDVYFITKIITKKILSQSPYFLQLLEEFEVIHIPTLSNYRRCYKENNNNNNTL